MHGEALRCHYYQEAGQFGRCVALGTPLEKKYTPYALKMKEGWSELQIGNRFDEVDEVFSYEDISVEGKVMWKVLGWSKAIGRNWNPPTKIRHTEEELEWYYAKYPKLKEMAMPTRGGHAEYLSIRAHELMKAELGLAEKLIIPSRIVNQQVEYDKKQILGFKGKMLEHNVFDLARSFTECMNGMESILPPESGPGFPYQLKHAKNRDMLERPKDLFALVVNRFTCLTQVLSGEWWKLSPEEAVRKGLCDPIKVFIKNEATGLKKLRKDMARLIWNLSLVDQIVGKMLTKHLDNEFVRNWDKVHSKSGMPMTGEGFTKLFEMIKTWEELGCTDNSAFDYTVTFKELMADTLRRVASLGYAIDCGKTVLENIHVVMETGSWHMKMLVMMMFFRAQCIAVLSNGLVLQQMFQGHQKSGDITTSSGNGARKSMGHGTVCESMGVQWDPSQIMTMGDDCAFEARGIDKDNYIEMNRLMHKKIKEYDVSKTSFTFCSTEFNRELKTWRYNNPAKSIMHYLTEIHPNESQIRGIIDQIGDVEFAKSPLMENEEYSKRFVSMWESEKTGSIL